MEPGHNPFPSFRPVPRTGVIYVMEEAAKRGFYYGNPDWANLGQGAPETGPLDGAPERLTSIPLEGSTCEYAPVAGHKALRDAVAQLYNHRYRRGMASQYSWENVAISAGGRLALTRVTAGLGPIHLGHFLPDYTAYEELLDLFRAFVPIPILLRSGDGFRIDSADLTRELVGKGLGGLLLSNPCNPTGQVIHGKALTDLVQLASSVDCALIFDEFYSHYLYGEAAAHQTSLSAAAHVEDVNRAPVVILDGLTKNWRYPGLRLSWTVGPKDIIKRVASAGSFIDGGAAHALQKAAIPLLNPDTANQEARAIQKCFAIKRDLLLKELPSMGFTVRSAPQGAFYCFASLEGLPLSLRDGMDFFKACLEHQVICVPGVFFDVNPGQRRSHLPSRLRGFVRLSFGPAQQELVLGLNKLRRMIADHGGRLSALDPDKPDSAVGSVTS